MTAIGIVLVALGAILRYAVTADASGIDLDMVGLIMMATGGVAFVLGLFEGKFRKSRVERHSSTDGTHVVEESETSGL